MGYGSCFAWCQGCACCFFISGIYSPYQILFIFYSNYFLYRLWCLLFCFVRTPPLVVPPLATIDPMLVQYRRGGLANRKGFTVDVVIETMTTIAKGLDQSWTWLHVREACRGQWRQWSRAGRHRRCARSRRWWGRVRWNIFTWLCGSVVLNSMLFISNSPQFWPER